MARIRSIKPEFPQSESIGRLSRDARLLFIQLWTVADDVGRARAASRMLASLLYPYDDDAPTLIDGWLDELEREGCVRRYEVEGSRYLEIMKWLKHQKIDKPSASKLPSFDEPSRALPRRSRKVATDLGSRIKDLGGDLKEDAGAPAPAGEQPKPPVEPKAPKALTPQQELAKVLDEPHALAVVKHREKLRAGLTDLAARLLAANFAKWHDPNAAADAMMAHGWKGFDPAWMDRLAKDRRPAGQPVTNGMQRLADKLSSYNPENGHDLEPHHDHFDGQTIEHEPGHAYLPAGDVLAK